MSGEKKKKRRRLPHEVIDEDLEALGITPPSKILDNIPKSLNLPTPSELADTLFQIKEDSQTTDKKKLHTEIERKPWVKGLIDNLFAVEIVSRTELDSKNRICLILIDDCIEIAFKKYILYEKRFELPSGSKYREKLHKIIRKHTQFEDNIWDKLEYYYGLRCDFYHQEAEKTIANSYIDDYKSIAIIILEKLFGIAYSRILYQIQMESEDYIPDFGSFDYDKLDFDETKSVEIQYATEQEVISLVNKINKAPNKLAKLNTIHKLKVLCYDKHVGHHQIIFDIFSSIQKERDQEVRRELTNCIYLILLFEEQKGMDQSIMDSVKENCLDTLYNISMSDPDLGVRGEAVSALTLLIYDKKAIDYLFGIFELDNESWNSVKRSWKFNFYGIAKSDNKMYFLNKLEKMIESPDENISKRAYEMNRQIRSEYWHWFGD